MDRRHLVGILYITYAVVIGVFWGVQEVVVACLGLHISGVIAGLCMERQGSEYKVYPIPGWRNTYILIDIVQAGMLVACIIDESLTEAAAVVALVGVAMCIAKVMKVKR